MGRVEASVDCKPASKTSRLFDVNSEIEESLLIQGSMKLSKQ